MDTLETMQAFARVVEAGSFTEAARRWGRSKAVVSKYVAQLEARLGVTLLVRTTRTLRLSETGRAYHERCVQLLEELADLEGAVGDTGRVPRGILRVTAPPGLAEAFGADLIGDFARRYPQVQVDLHLSHAIVDLVREGFDAALRVTEPEDSGLISRRLASVAIIACASPGYLAEHGAPRHPIELRDHPCLVDTNFKNAGRWRFEVDGDRIVVPVQGPVRVNNPMTVCGLACQGLGIALLPDFVARAALEDGRLVRILRGFEGYRWAIHVVYPPRRHLSAKVRVFVDYVAEQLRGDPRAEAADDIR